MIYSIYLITNIINQKKYVGVTNNFLKRMREHRGCYNSRHCLYRAIKKYGWKNFLCEIIFQTKDSLYAYKEAESLFIKEYNCNHSEFGYNLTAGGEGTSGYIVSEETRKKQSIAKKGRKLSEEHKIKIGNVHRGVIFSDERRTKISNKLKGNKNFLGKSFTQETIDKLSEQKAKDWKIVSPDGTVVHVHNMRKFCVENNLSPSAISRVMNDLQKHHKGWTKPIQ